MRNDHSYNIPKTVTNLRQPFPLLQKLRDFSRPDGFVGSLTEGEDFPTGDTERPHIGFVGESAMQNGLESEPLDGHPSALSVIHVLVHVQQLRQPEIGDFNLRKRIENRKIFENDTSLMTASSLVFA